MTGPGAQEPDNADLVRPYVITNGRELPDDDQFQLITLVTVAEGEFRRPAHPSPEEKAVLELCAGGYLSVAEISGHLRLPVGVVKILLSDLAQGGHLITRAPAPRAQLVDRQLLQEVLDGLHARFG